MEAVKRRNCTTRQRRVRKMEALLRTLYYGSGASVAEIARRLQWPEEAVKDTARNWPTVFKRERDGYRIVSVRLDGRRLRHHE